MALLLLMLGGLPLPSAHAEEGTATPAVKLDAVTDTAATSARPAEGPPIVAVLDFASDTLPESELAALSQAFWSRLALQGNMRMLPREETRAWLIRHDLYPGMPYAAPVPLDKVVQALKASYLVCGRIDRIANAWSLELTLQGAQADSKLQRAELQRATPQEIMESMDWLAAQVRRALNGQDLAGLIATAPAFAGAKATGEGRAAAAPSKKTESPKRKVADDKPVERERPQKTSAASKRGKTTAKTSHATESKPEGEDWQPVPEAHEAPQEKPAEHGASAEAEGAAGEHVVASGSSKGEGDAAEEPQAKPQEKAAAGHSAEAKEHAPAEAAAVSTPAMPAPAEQARKLFEEAQALPADDATRIEKLERAASLAPKESLYPEKLANEYYRRSNFDQALRATDRALKLKPGDSMLLTVKGSALYEMKDYPAAREAHQAALKADGKNNWARFNLALALTQMKSPEATTAWRNYLEEARNDPDQRDLLPEARRHLTALGGAVAEGTEAPAASGEHGADH